MKIKKIFGEFGIIILLMGIVLGLLMSLGIDAYVIRDTSNLPDFTPKLIPSSQEDIINNCKNLDLVNTSLCFRDNIKTFFNYSDDEKEFVYDRGDAMIKIRESEQVLRLTKANTSLLDYLKNNGGICTEFSLLYLELCNQTTFKCSTAENDGVMKVFYGHEYLVMYNSTNYCKLDQLKVTCGENNEK